MAHHKKGLSTGNLRSKHVVESDGGGPISLGEGLIGIGVECGGWRADSIDVFVFFCLGFRGFLVGVILASSMWMSPDSRIVGAFLALVWRTRFLLEGTWPFSNSTSAKGVHCVPQAPPRLDRLKSKKLWMIPFLWNCGCCRQVRHDFLIVTHILVGTHLCWSRLKGLH